MWYSIKMASKILVLRFYNFFIRPFLSSFGLVSCCDNMQLEERICSRYYSEYRCKTCGRSKVSLAIQI